MRSNQVLDFRFSAVFAIRREPSSLPRTTTRCHETDHPFPIDPGENEFVPAPGSIALLVLASGLLLRRRREVHD
ncbi:MAG: MYXO-CTERM sorting domain-containing protein [Phycisphaerales bacterium]